MKENYEILVILDSKLNESELEKAIDKIKLIIKNCAGDVLKLENQGRKKLSYVIKEREDGFLIFMEIELDNDKVSEVDRNFKLLDSILRYSIIRKLKTEENKQEIKK